MSPATQKPRQEDPKLRATGCKASSRSILLGNLVKPQLKTEINRSEIQVSGRTQDSVMSTAK